MIQRIFAALNDQLIEGNIVRVSDPLQTLDERIRHTDGLVGVLRFFHCEHVDHLTVSIVHDVGNY